MRTACTGLPVMILVLFGGGSGVIYQPQKVENDIGGVGPRDCDVLISGASDEKSRAPIADIVRLLYHAQLWSAMVLGLIGYSLFLIPELH